MSMAAQLQFRDVTLGYDRHPAVHHLSGEVLTGALLAVVGPNGAGKSTLFRGLVGILKPLAGSITTCGLDIRDIAYLPQTADIDRTFPISVFDFVGTGLWRATGLFGAIGGAARKKIELALAAVGLRLREPRHRHAVGRADAALAICAGAVAGRAADRAR
jgi:zinc/manganese transport system ATP-binding protein